MFAINTSRDAAPHKGIPQIDWKYVMMLIDQKITALIV